MTDVGLAMGRSDPGGNVEVAVMDSRAEVCWAWVVG